MGTVLTLTQAITARERLRAGGKRLVFTNGHFDLLHVGHVDYLEKAHQLGNALFGGINGDSASEMLKGTGRPIVTAADRARLVAALHCVEAAIIFDALTADDLITALKP